MKLNWPGTGGFYVFVWLVISSSLWLGGCARLRPGVKPAEAVKRADRLLIAEVSGVQHAYSVAPRKGYNTVEIYLENHSTNTLVFNSARLEGKELPIVPAKPGSGTNLAPVGEVVWSQFYPTPELKPAGAIVYQLNLRAAFTAQRKLELGWGVSGASTENRQSPVIGWSASGGKVINIVVPRFRQPETLITAITFPLDYAKVYVQYQSKHIPPTKVWLNSQVVSNFLVRPSSEPDTPDMLALTAPFKITTGKPLHLKLQFPDGSARQALVRALGGVLIDAYPLAQKERADLGLDTNPPVLNLVAVMGGDVACHDVQKRDYGAAATPVIEERLRLLQQHQEKLAAIHYCTAMYPELWNIYGQITDAAYANPYRRGWGRNPARFIEEEEECIKKAWQAGRPRPFLWIPESFKSRGRFLEGPELEVLGWMTLIRGGKGIKYLSVQGNLGGYPPGLIEAMKNLNRAVHEHLAELAPLMLVSERTTSTPSRSPSNQPAPLKIYTAWSGDAGILVMVRNLDYRTDGQANDDGRAPRFHAAPKADLTIPVNLPDWFAFKSARDLLTGRNVACAVGKQGVEMSLEKLEAFALLWLANK